MANKLTVINRNVKYELGYVIGKDGALTDDG